MTETSPPPLARGPGRVVNLVVAGVMFCLAVLGLLLPVLPATPFLLLTSYFLVRSSPKLHARLMQSRVFGAMLRDWNEHRGVRPHVKVAAIGAMTVAVGASLAFGNLSTPLKAAVVTLALIGLVVVIRLKEIRS